MKGRPVFTNHCCAQESRHYEDYIGLAWKYDEADTDERIRFFAELEAELISTPDDEFRFHSGIPAVS